jgi:hypothetical protein
MRRALPELVLRWHVLALVRSHDPQLAALGITQIEGDLDQPDTLTRLAGISDAVIHSAPPPPQGADDTRTRNLIAVLRRGKSLPRQLVYISTSGVYGDCGGARVSETRTPAARRRGRRGGWMRNGACALRPAVRPPMSRQHPARAGHLCRRPTAAGTAAQRPAADAARRGQPYQPHPRRRPRSGLHRGAGARTVPTGSTTSATTPRWPWANGSTCWPTLLTAARAPPAAGGRPPHACHRCSGHS